MRADDDDDDDNVKSCHAMVSEQMIIICVNFERTIVWPRGLSAGWASERARAESVRWQIKSKLIKRETKEFEERKIEKKKTQKPTNDENLIKSVSSAQERSKMRRRWRRATTDKTH